MKNLAKTVSCYILWGISTLFSFYLVFNVHKFLIIVMETLGLGKYTINFLDKMLILLIGIATVVFFLYIQHAYQQQGWHLFFLVSSIQILIYGLVSFLQQVLIHLNFPVLQLYDFFILLCSLLLSGLFVYLYLFYKRKIR